MNLYFGAGAPAAVDSYSLGYDGDRGVVRFLASDAGVVIYNGGEASYAGLGCGSATGRRRRPWRPHIGADAGFVGGTPDLSGFTYPERHLTSAPYGTVLTNPRGRPAGSMTLGEYTAYADRVASGSVGGIAYGLAHQAGASAAVQDLVYGLGSAADGMLVGAALRPNSPDRGARLASGGAWQFQTVAADGLSVRAVSEGWYVSEERRYSES